MSGANGAAYEHEERESICFADFDDAEPVREHRRYPSLAEQALALADAETPRRLPFDLATLDEITRGGVPAKRIVVVSGAPGAAKTALVVQWVDTWARAGARVVYLAADQAPEDALGRLAQRAGCLRDDIEGDADARRAAWREAATAFGALPGCVVLDGAVSTIEDAGALLLELPGDGPRVLAVDSLQTARCAGAADLSSPRERIDATLAVVRDVAKQGATVVLVSEMARGAYRSRDAAQNTTALASSKESGAIEYCADVFVALRSVKDEPDLVDVEVAKNRLGPKRDFALKLDRRRAALAETTRDEPDDDTRDAQRAARDEKKLAEIEQRMVLAMMTRTLKSKGDVYAAVRGRMNLNVSALSRLETSGRVGKVEGVYRPVVADAGSGTP